MKWHFPLLLAGFFILGWQANHFFSRFDQSLDELASSVDVRVPVLKDEPVDHVPLVQSKNVSAKASRTLADAAVFDAFKQSLESKLYAQSIDALDQLLLDEKLQFVAEKYLFEYIDRLEANAYLDEALALLQVYADYYQQPKFYYRLAQIMYQQGEGVAAIDILFQLKGQQSGALSKRLSQQIQLWVVEVYSRLVNEQKYGVLLAWLEQLESLEPGNGQYILLHAQVLMLLKQWDDANNEYQHLMTFPDYYDLAVSKTLELDEKLNKLNPEEIVIPLKRVGKHYAATAMINDTKSVDLLLDTGASLTVVKRSALQDVFLDEGKLMQFNTANGTTQGQIYRLTLFSLDTVSLTNFDLAVLDMPDMESADGLLGMNFFENFQFRIDQKENVLRLLPRVDE